MIFFLKSGLLLFFKLSFTFSYITPPSTLRTSILGLGARGKGGGFPPEPMERQELLLT